MQAALEVFGRSTIISATKKALFLSVIEEASAAQNAAFHQLLSRTLNRDADIEVALIAFGCEFAAAGSCSAQAAKRSPGGSSAG